MALMPALMPALVTMVRMEAGPKPAPGVAAREANWVLARRPHSPSQPDGPHSSPARPPQRLLLQH